MSINAVAILVFIAAFAGMFFGELYGRFILRVFLAVKAGPAYSGELRKEFGHRVYAALHDLEEAGLITRHEEPGGPERGGRPRYRYEVEP